MPMNLTRGNYMNILLNFLAVLLTIASVTWALAFVGFSLYMIYDFIDRFLER